MTQLKALRYELTALPALAAPVGLYAPGAFLAGGGGGFADTLATAALSLPSPSAVRWSLSWRELILLAGLIALFADLLKSTGTGRAAVVYHVLSVGLLVICLVLILRYLDLLPPHSDGGARCDRGLHDHDARRDIAFE